MARSMTAGSLPSDQVARLLRSYEGMAKEQAEVKAQLVKLAPAWSELRKVPNELNGLSGPDERDQPARPFAQLRRISLAQRGFDRVKF